MQLKMIDWTLRTGASPEDGTDTRVSVEVWRDNTMVENLWVEPGNTTRLDSREVQTYSWEFPDAGIEFDSIGGQLKVVLRAWGDDLWKALDIDSKVTFDVLIFTPSVHWVRRTANFTFAGVDVLSTDSAEGRVTLQLNY
ncbi:hypothetical protein [Antrihabitans sp. YC2-6]|uniref:hypothetical protein n=1 Tax=Antrihabitans sp. YC2-6 TaxID=2799498 RepID=UPI0018F349C5|nr:hypothetical protein [Antrihabitans sp. YC2-6]MBJ8348360.1 hypothetical protein [Antrihabitans sp. YC2-6]